MMYDGGVGWLGSHHVQTIVAHALFMHVPRVCILVFFIYFLCAPCRAKSINFEIRKCIVAEIWRHLHITAAHTSLPCVCGN